MKIIGHKKIIKWLDRSIERDTVSQAYVFSGPIGVGKYAVALNFAEKLSGPFGAANADLIVIAPEIEEKKGIIKKRDIKIEKIRELQHQFGLATEKGKRKTVIIDDADRLNVAAQNALLKTLEEPNEDLLLILIAQDERKILPTILSRCQRIRFGTVSREEMSESIPAAAKNQKEIIFWAFGRPGLMLELMKNGDELVFRKESLEELKILFEKNLTKKFGIAEKLSKDSDIAIKKLNLWLIIMRQALLEKDRFVAISKNKALELIEKTGESLELIRGTNSNVKLALESLFINF